jgi:hypothetical protein
MFELIVTADMNGNVSVRRASAEHIPSIVAIGMLDVAKGIVMDNVVEPVTGIEYEGANGE